LSEAQRAQGLRLEQMARELPEPPPEVPAELRQAGLEALQAELRALALRLQSLEPVNMLALDGGKRKTNTIPKADWRLMHFMP
jgi:chromosome segregation protein